MGGPAPGTLYVVATPIGNLEDVTLRALRVLGEVALVAAEDTRVTAKLLGRHGIETPLTSFREQNAATATPKIVERLLGGEDVALVSDAGTPSVSDPGAQLVAAARAAGATVTPLPGPSALAAALSVAGLPGDGVRFWGFVPREGKRRRGRLEALARDPALSVLYEAPGRLGATLKDLAALCGGERRALVCRELTKLHEEVAEGTLAQLAQRFAGEVRGEVTVVVAGAPEAAGDGAELDEDQLRELVAAELAAGRSAKDAAAALSRALGLPRKAVYQLAVEWIEKDRESR